jgi:DNA-binding transcriptional MocR family regulator
MDVVSDRDYLYEGLAGEISSLIASGTYPPGDRLPSVRKLSAQKRLSVSTVLQAYMLLESRGLIEARPQSGYYVRPPAAPVCPEPEISSPEPDPSQVSLRELAMLILRDSENPGLVQLGTALPNPDLLPTKKLNRIAASLARERGDQSNLYFFPPGYEPLRVQIAQRALVAGCSLTPADIVITSGCTEAVELSLRAVCQPGDIVAIESPTYFGILQTIESLGLQALEIPTHPRDGISLEALQFAVDHNPVRACLVVSNFNNPLGSCMPEENKRQLVELLGGRQIPLIESDISGEIYFGEQRPRTAKSFDKKGLVLLCSSFSKDICPGYRVGWAAPGRFRARFEWLKFVSSGSTTSLSQMAVAEFIASGGYDHHLRRLRREYAFSVEQMALAVVRHFPEGTRVTRPAGGFVLWIQLPEIRGNVPDSLELYKDALRAGISIAPGYLFSASDQYRNFIRLNAAVWNLEVERAVARLGEMLGG